MDSDPIRSDEEPLAPPASDRKQVAYVEPPHPALLDEETLLVQCDLRFQRRSGPGGQHRNKTSSGVFLHHEPTGVTAEATERRSQADNRSIALGRLRLRLAIELRSRSLPEGELDEARKVERETSLREKYRGHSLKFRETHPDRPAVLALMLDDLHVGGGQPSLVGKAWSVSTTSIVNLLKSHAPAIVLVNAIRSHHGRGPLR